MLLRSATLFVFLSGAVACGGAPPPKEPEPPRAEAPQREVKLVVKAKSVTDQAERTELYRKAQVVFKEQAPWFTIAHAVQLVPARKEVVDFKPSPFGRHTFYGVDIKP